MTNPHFGSVDDLKALSAAIHGRGMYLMVDVVSGNVGSLMQVANHLGAAPWTKPWVPQFGPFDDPLDYHPYCIPTDWDDQEQIEKCEAP